MSIRSTLVGTACVFVAAAFTAGTAGAAPLTSFAGVLTTTFSSLDIEDNSSSSDNIKGWLIGGSAAGPLPDLPNLNFQADAAYKHNWDDDYSREDWNIGASLFWAGDMGRIGANGNYTNFNRVGHITTGGVFGEWYFDAITAMAKGGWVSSGGTELGGHGNYLGAALGGYPMPNLAITAGIEWANIVSGQGNRLYGREGWRVTDYEISAEFLFSDALGLAGFVGYTYEDEKFFSDESNNNNIWMVGLRWYTGGGSLVERHRNGNLNPWLPATGPFSAH